MQNPSPTELMQAALEISAAAEPISLRYFRSGVTVEDKADESPVTAADRETERTIRAEIERRFPDHAILGEEFGKSDADSQFTWIIDPIDGTRSFICGVPLFGMLLGVLQGGRPVAGVIRMPALGEVFAGSRGSGATMNGAPIRCRSTTKVDEGRIFINEANRLFANDPKRLARLLAFGHTRRFFNDCYPFGLIAMGQIDVVVDFDLQPYDYLPVVPVVEAAGGVITDWSGAPLGLGSDGTVLAAATPELHKAAMDLLR
jgi:inositol-phosphate phosphatase / L-galactose 1-phosphate phosphatase / histidinol-phosphatase